MNDCDNLCLLLSNEIIHVDVARTLYNILEKRGPVKLFHQFKQTIVASLVTNQEYHFQYEQGN